MRGRIVVAAAFAILTATAAQAAEWCGYGARANSVVECGYTSVNECETALGKGGMCFVDPDYALNRRHASPLRTVPTTAAPVPETGRG